MIPAMPSPGYELVVAAAGDYLSQFESSEDNTERIRRKRCRILVVDNEPVFRHSVAFTLKNTYGAAVDEAPDGPVAIQKSRGRSFHLVLMDVYLDDDKQAPNGIEIAQRLRGDGIVTPIVLMSAYCTPDQEQLAEDLGFRLLLKPDIFDDLEKILLKCCGDDES